MILIAWLACHDPGAPRPKSEPNAEPVPVEDGAGTDTSLGIADCADPASWCSDACPCDADADGYVSAEMGGLDCDDSEAGVHPDAVELCNREDDDCNGLPDDEDPEVVITNGVMTWMDADGDGYGDAANASLRCEPSTAWVTDNDDCDDANAAIHPNTTDWCDSGIDNDCDGLSGDDDPDVEMYGPPYWPDVDGDGFGDADTVPHYCSHPPDWVGNGDDCNDTNASVNPDTEWHQDLDADGFGDPAAPPVVACEAPDGGYVRFSDAEDCNDSDASVHPEMLDDCDFVDSNCDGVVDEAAVPINWVFDSDGDGFGVDPWQGAPTCASPGAGWVDAGLGLDCDDGDAAWGGPVDWFEDLDGDGFGALLLVHACEPAPDAVALGGDCDDADTEIPGPSETCGGGDEDCDGEVGFDDHVDLATTMDGWIDLDGDGLGNAASYVPWCQDQPVDVVCNDDDCDDFDASSLSGKAYVYDGDGDGFGSGDAVASETVCDAPAPNYVDADNAADCNDADPDARPNGVERYANGVDDDCDGLIDEGATTLISEVTDETWSLEVDCEFGQEIGLAPDLDGDGRAEVLVGAPYYGSYDGAVFWAGPTGELRLWIEGVNSYYGHAPATFRDMDGDGAVDVIIGSGYEEFGGANDAGTVRTFFGPVLDGFATRGTETSGAVVGGLVGSGYFGYDVAVGDLDDDGAADLLAGSFGVDEVYLFRGPQAPLSVSALATTTITSASNLGIAVGVFGDIDGDGVDEWAAAANLESPGGAVYVFSGLPHGEMLAVDAPIVIHSEFETDFLGASVAAIGDVTGDGMADMGIAATSYGALNWGRVYVFSGALAGEVAAVDATAHVFTLNDYSYCGSGLGAPGDLDADGVADLAVACDTKKLRLLFGPFAGAIDAALAPTTLEIPVGTYPSIPRAPMDVDGDGFLDLAVGDASGDAAYLLYGPL